MFRLRKVMAMIHGKDLDHESLYGKLEASAIPISVADCRTCSDPCDQGHESYPNKFDVDMETQLLGTVKPYHRQVVISTGKYDWDRVVTETAGSLAAYLLDVQNKAPSPAATKATAPKEDGDIVPAISGAFLSSDSTKISILNGSHNTLCDDCARETVLIFPDYKVVTGISRTMEGADGLWKTSVDPTLGRVGAVLEQSPFKTWIVPYSCVILLCSHKTRDNRCSIAAPKLEHTFSQSLESKGWTVDTQIEDPSHSMGPPLEDFQGTQEQKEEDVIKQLKCLSSQRKVLLIRNSHVGGHKFAGNCIIHTPQGSSVWYGRVTPHEVESIVENTIIKGLVLPLLLRGGLNISRPGCSSLLDW